MTGRRARAERPEEASERPAAAPDDASPRAESPAGAPPTEPDAVEPSGDQDPAVEAEVEASTERSEPGADAAPDSAGGADDPLERAERQRDEYLALAQRTQADFENYRKRAAKEAAAAGARAKAALVREMLPAVDNLERALAAAGDGDQSLLEGVRLVHSELTGALERNGVESFEPAGEIFDPTLHEALSTRAQDGAKAGVVLDVVEKGYRLDGTVLRPARVVVSA